MKICLFTLCAFVLAGCSGGGGQSSKALFSVWSLSDKSFSIDMSTMSYGTQTVTVTTSSGEQCQASVTISGAETSGNYTIASSTYVPSTGGGSDPGCSTLNESGTYSNQNATLTLCASANDCLAYY